MKFRKKPVVIDAVQWTGNNAPDLDLFLAGRASVNGNCILIPTLEGTMRGEIGDWIIKGVKGEYYPCKPDIFAAIIDAVQWTGNNAPDLDLFLAGRASVNGNCILIPTLEGTMRGEIGDWIIKGVKGEYYPCKPDIFAASCEPVEAA